MNSCRKYLVLLLALLFLDGCKAKKKPSLSGDEPVEVSDFIEFFPLSSLPFQFTDSVWKKKEKDSVLISHKVFTQFVPDTLLTKIFGKNIKPRIYPLGRVVVPGAETYLFVKTLSGQKKAIYILGFDKNQQFITGMPLLRPGMLTFMQTVLMDRKYTLTRSTLRKNPDGSISEGKEVYVLNTDARHFMLIMTEALDDKMTELINPIDTLPRKNKFSADYTGGKMNLVSVRDGRKNDRFSFFIHVEKNNGECTGGLKGEAIFRSPTMAEYREEGDPCILRFIFSGTSVTLKEIEGCGSRRGLRCVFDGNFVKKKVVRPKVNKVK